MFVIPASERESRRGGEWVPVPVSWYGAGSTGMTVDRHSRPRAGIQGGRGVGSRPWIPAFAGMTDGGHACGAAAVSWYGAGCAGVVGVRGFAHRRGDCKIHWTNVKKGAINPILFLTGMVQSVIGYNTCFSFDGTWRDSMDIMLRKRFEEVR